MLLRDRTDFAHSLSVLSVRRAVAQSKYEIFWPDALMRLTSFLASAAASREMIDIVFSVEMRVIALFYIYV